MSDNSEPLTAAQQQLQHADRTERAIIRQLREVQSPIPIFDTGDFEHMQRVAKALAMASVIPDHLRARPYFFPSKGSLAPADLKQIRAELGEAEWARAWQEADARTTANCFLVVNQARNWNMDPVAVAMASYVVGGKIAYEGKLVAALVNTRAKLVQKLWYTFEGEGVDLVITVHGTREGEDEDRTVRARVRDVKTENQMWTKDPEQKLVYTGSIKWARRWVPEVVLGVMTDDDLELMEREKNITPVATGGGGVQALEERFAAQASTAPAPSPAPAPLGRGEGGAAAKDQATIDKAVEESAPVARPKAIEKLEPPSGAGGAGVTLSAEDVSQLRGKAEANKVAWSDVEEYFGRPVEEYSAAGKDERALWGEVEDAIRLIAKRARESGSSLFDDSGKRAGKG